MVNKFNFQTNLHQTTTKILRSYYGAQTNQSWYYVKKYYAIACFFENDPSHKIIICLLLYDQQSKNAFQDKSLMSCKTLYHSPFWLFIWQQSHYIHYTQKCCRNKTWERNFMFCDMMDWRWQFGNMRFPPMTFTCSW